MAESAEHLNSDVLTDAIELKEARKHNVVQWKLDCMKLWDISDKQRDYQDFISEVLTNAGIEVPSENESETETASAHDNHLKGRDVGHDDENEVYGSLKEQDQNDISTDDEIEFIGVSLLESQRASNVAGPVQYLGKSGNDVKGKDVEPNHAIHGEDNQLQFPPLKRLKKMDDGAGNERLVSESESQHALQKCDAFEEDRSPRVKFDELHKNIRSSSQTETVVEKQNSIDQNQVLKEEDP